MNPEFWAAEDLEAIANAGLSREGPVFCKRGIWLDSGDARILNFASNDYLQLAEHPAVIRAARDCLEGYGLGTGSSRLLSGTTPFHARLEEALATFLDVPSVAAFSSGYLANLGFLSAALGRNDVVLADRLVHASIVDGIRLSNARHFRFRHNDLNDLERLLKTSARPERSSRILVVTESVFSMDGDRAPLSEIQNLAERYGAGSYFDEAHAVGVFGPRGRGLSAGVRRNFIGGTLSKSLGVCGGYIGGRAELKSWLHSTARSFIFNTSIPAAICAGGLAALDVLKAEPERGERLLRLANLLRTRLRAAGLDCLQSDSQIIPILIGGNERTMLVSKQLRARGIYAPAIRQPTVEQGRERLRISVTLGMTEELLQHAADDIIEVARLEGICR